MLETVESTLKQSYDEFEIIVKDGFSKDESICKLPQDKRIHLVQKKDTGIYDAMNQGMTEMLKKYSELVELNFLTKPHYVKI